MLRTTSSFVALYRGRDINTAKLVAATTDPDLVEDVSRRLLALTPAAAADPVAAKLNGGRRAALRVIHKEAADARQV